MLENKTDLLNSLEGGLIVSCQPLEKGYLDGTNIVVATALAVIKSGAKGIRIEGIERIRAVRNATTAPVIGIVKRNLKNSSVRITPFKEDIENIYESGANIVAIDATNRERPVPFPDLVQTAKFYNLIVMADCSNEDEGKIAHDLGCEIIGTTLSGYIDSKVPYDPDYELITKFSRKGFRVMAEGRIKTPQDAIKAFVSGAWAITVGSAITRPEHITQWFINNIKEHNEFS